MRLAPLAFSFGICALLVLGAPRAQAEMAFEFQKNERIAFIGNALPDRMQHHGWLEAYLQHANPDKQLVIRNMGFTGDEVAHRPREVGFMTEDEYLSHVEADVIFAFFGYNESFSRDPETFKQELVEFIDHTLAMPYNGSTPPRLVLFSPIAHEDLGTPNLPDGTENNLWLSIYTDAMARVAHDKGVPFVDLFAPTRALYEQSNAPLTINGVHLHSDGNKALARVILEALGQPMEETHLERIRAAVLEKNWCWFNRYRATNGNDVWGTRASLKFVDDQTNEEVLQHELVMLDIMSANRDKVIWEAVHGRDLEPDDSNVPDPVLVETNYEPSEKTGRLEYLPAEKALETFTLPEGMVANVFASEAMFPELVNPVQMDVDPQGRIWVAAWQTYPKWQPDREMLDRLLILPDHDGDGVADEAITFAYVHNPTGFTFWNDGVIVVSAPNIFFLKDTTGDNKADYQEILFSGLDSADTHHSPNGFRYGPDGYIYYQRGIFNISNVETPWQAAQLSGTSGMYRFNPRTHRFSFHAENPPNAHGGDFDYWGYHYATDATGGKAFQVRMAGEGLFEMHQLLEQTVRPVAASGILSSQHFPEENNGNFILLNTIGFLGIKQYSLEINEDGEAWGTEVENLLVSSDGNFRPADFAIGEDGALYVADWSNAIIGHMQHNIRDPSRDHEHGRVYRITVEDRPLQEPVAIHGEPIEALLDVLKHPVDGVRLRARMELSGRDTGEVIAALKTWMEQFDGTSAEDAHPLLEALWLHQQHNVVNEGLLTVLLHSPEVHARHAAERVEYMWKLEGQLESGTVVPHMDHTAHARHQPLHDYLHQEPSPEPYMDGDTLVIHIQTLKEQMKYDREAFAAAPGMPVRLIFSNPDAMPHNLILVQPGAASQVAMAAMMLGAEGYEKEWIPESNRILFASRMLARDETETIEFTAPETLGAYDYLCTYPGHAMLMNGVLHVVEDVEAWYEEHEASQEEHDEGHDHTRQFVRDWSVEDIAGDLDQLATGRSLERGRQVFEAASCHTCHEPAQTGGRIGPDLAGVSERFDPHALLTALLAPSEQINEEYKSWQITIETDDIFEDNLLFGLIVEESESFLRIVTDPLNDAEGRVIAREKITDLRASPLSTMPTGLLSSFTREEILDLLAYLQSLAATEAQTAGR